MAKKPFLSFSNVGVARGGKQILENISFNIRHGEHTAIVGPNGAGKSTLIKLITRELYPTDGRLLVDGKEGWRVEDLRPLLGIVTDDWAAMFAQDITGREAVLSGFFSSVGLWKNNRVTKRMESKASAVMKRMKLSHLADKRMTHVSSGEARRLLIARALIHAPRALILDEPTNNLDLFARREFERALQTLVRARVTLILVTHRFSDIPPFVKRVIILKKGRIAAIGAKEDVLTKRCLQRIFNAPVNVVRQEGRWIVF